MTSLFAPAFPIDGNKTGITSLEFVAAMVLPAVVSVQRFTGKDEAAKEAIAYAEALLNELGKRNIPSRPKAGAV